MDEPPEFGSMDFSIPFGPVSLQTHSSRLREAKERFQKHLPRTAFLFSGDVSIEIEWLVHEAARYESDSSPDIDNILKPLMDVLCGPQALLIDDNQVQSIRCSWIDWTLREERLDFRIRFSPDDFVRKEGLIFVEISKSLCMPVNKNAPAEALIALLEVLKKQMDATFFLRRSGIDYYGARTVMSIQRVFHRSRLSRFNVVPMKKLLQDTKKALGGKTRRREDFPGGDRH